MEPYKPREPDKRIAAIHFPLSFWEEVQQAAADEGVSASEWVRRACREKLEQP